MGSIGKERGRGERKAQMHFLTRARRSLKQKNAMTFVAFVQAVEQTSQAGVVDAMMDIAQEHYHVSLTRRGISDDIEKGAMTLSHDAQYCAHLVDKAADSAGVCWYWARQSTLYAAYQQALSTLQDDEDCDDGDDDDKHRTPAQAAIDFLLTAIGSVPSGEDRKVVHLLSQMNGSTITDDDSVRLFASNLLALCRTEKERRSQPVEFSLTSVIGGPKAALQQINKSNQTTLSHMLDTSHLLVAIQSAKEIVTPSGCQDIAICIKGNGKYSFSTRAPPEMEGTALGYLERILSHVQDAWRDSVSTNATGFTEIEHAVKPQQIPNGHSVQPTLNIGVIGDVANGKSTLVKAISGKRTQSHSSEQQQHGITIRLGFANASVLQCQNRSGVCGSFSFLPESEDERSLPLCPKCNDATHVIRRFSLIDCPGHAELMATMLSGASAFDAVLLASSANVPMPSPQARQHLEAIKLSGILKKYRPAGEGDQSCIAIAQTKAELLTDESKNTVYRFTPEERLANHAVQGRHKLHKSVAAHAPIFPVCAPIGIGLEAIAEWIARLPIDSNDRGSASTPPGHGPMRLQVLRSFDVNRPGTAADGVNGGVLGGTIFGGGTISVGDVMEIRPGLLLSPRCKKTSNNEKKGSDNETSTAFQIQPLRFHCTSLMTGKSSLTSAGKGGLVAVGTSLEPSLCADNRMVGCVAGPPSTLPPVWGSSLFLNQLEYVDLLGCAPEGPKGSKIQSKPFELLKSGSEIRCHVGSATCQGTIVKISESLRKVEVRLEGPVCASKGSNVALEGKDDHARRFLLVAHAKLAGGDMCLDGMHHEKCPVVDKSLVVRDGQDHYNDGENDDNGEDAAHDKEGAHECLESDARYRKQFLFDLESYKDSQSAVASGRGPLRLSIPSPDIARDGGAHVLLSNFGLIAHALRREPEHMVSFLEKEGGLHSVLAGNHYSPATMTLRVRWRGGRGFAERFSSILKKYIVAYVTCHQCRGAFTELLTGKAELCCRCCNARRFVAKL